MSTLTHTVRREFRVAFSLKAQPLWFRVIKWIVFLAFAARYHGASWFWPLLGACFVTGLAVHFLYRWKTRAWTRCWGGWKDLAAGRR
jgi:hypothetical protein